MTHSRLTTGTNTPADVLRALADHTDNHHLNIAHANLSIMPRHGRADVLLHTSNGRAINAILTWARSLNTTHIDTHRGATGYHLHAKGILPGGTPLEVCAITSAAETEALATTNTNGPITIDQLANHAKGE